MSRQSRRARPLSVAASALLALASCRSAPPPSGEPPAAPSPPAAEVKAGCDPVAVPAGSFTLVGDPRACKGGRFVMETNSYPTHLNIYGPERDENLAHIYTEAMFNTLVSIHLSTLEVIPELASSWEEEGGGKTLTFHLDPDAKWSDGKPITSKDVLATFDLITNPATVEVVYKTQFADRFEHPVALDDHTVRFTAKTASWRNILLFDDIYIMPADRIDPKTYLEQWKWQPPVVSGQYQLGASEAGKFLTLERRKDFWGEGKRQFIGTANFDELYFKVILNDDISFETMKKGDIDFFYVTKAQTWVEGTSFDKIKKGWIQKMSFFDLQPEPPSEWAFNLDHPLFSDARVRKAMFWLLDREYLHDQIFYHQYVNKNSYWPNSIYENPGNEKFTFNPEKGLELLHQAGWTEKDKDGVLIKDGKRFEFDLMYIHPTRERIYTPLQETYRKYGIKMNLKLIQPSAWIKVSQEKKFELIYANWGAVPFPEPREMWHSASADLKDTSNITHFKNPEVDKLIDQYEAEPDLQKRVAIIQKMDAIIYDQCPYMLSWYNPNWWLLWWDKFGMPEWVSHATLDIRQTNWKTWWYEPARADRLARAMQSGAAVPLSPPENTYWKKK